MNEYNDMMQANKMTVSIFVIEKKKDKFSNQNVPKAVMDQIPKMLRGKKFPLVNAKSGPQIHTLIADEEVFKKIPVKQNILQVKTLKKVICMHRHLLFFRNNR